MKALTSNLQMVSCLNSNKVDFKDDTLYSLNDY